MKSLESANEEKEEVRYTILIYLSKFILSSQWDYGRGNIRLNVQFDRDFLSKLNHIV